MRVVVPSCLALLLCLAGARPLLADPPAPADPAAKPSSLVAKDVDYQDGDAALQGHLAYDGAVAGKRPGVLVLPEWWGLNDYPKRRAEALAKEGYVAFAVDVYGKGKVTRDPKQAGEWAGEWRGPAHRDAMLRRVKAAWDVLAKQDVTDGSRIAAIGYCFGGALALDNAWSGVPWKAVVSFHGSLTTPTAEQMPGIRASILVCHGADDPHVPAEAVKAFQDAMKAAKTDCQVCFYSGAVHAFTNPDADSYGIDGVKYDAAAATRSWENALTFLKGTLAR
jgi:dienelactone hydrolase